MRKDYKSGKREDLIDPSRNVNIKKGNNAGHHRDQHNPPGNNGSKTMESQGNNDKHNKTANIGWLFYRDYYRGLESMSANKKKEALVDRNKVITSSEFKSFNTANENLKGFSCVEMEVLPPGLLIGSGISHGVPGPGDFELGFQFDYTTGLPVIPGSSVKGVLRSIFPMKGENDKTDYIKSLLPGWDGDIKKLGEILFEHDDLATSASPVFFDAIVSRGCLGSENGKLLGRDYITPHRDPLKNPTPIQFMKVLPGVRFKFYFKLPEAVLSLTRNDLTRLFISILEDVGVGAKTNVGYGHLKRIEYKQHSL